MDNIPKTTELLRCNNSGLFPAQRFACRPHVLGGGGESRSYNCQETVINLLHVKGWQLHDEKYIFSSDHKRSDSSHQVIFKILFSFPQLEQCTDSDGDKCSPQRENAGVLKSLLV